MVQRYFPESAIELRSPLNGERIIAGTGDIIQLRNSRTGGSVAGYVREIHARSVTLSHEDPYFRTKYLWHVVLGMHDYHKFFPGDRSYDLRKFDEFEVLKKHPNNVAPHNK
ncbi:MAG: hypothetical protein HYW22_00525 [Candidatus Aenigmarchaeota archaeon]|nr:hypothetical protein [Candidatus Aenigmarchaeota archaeon]